MARLRNQILMLVWAPPLGISRRVTWWKASTLWKAIMVSGEQHSSNMACAGACDSFSTCKRACLQSC